MPFFKREKPKPKFKSMTKTTIVSVEQQVGIDAQRCAQMMTAAEAALRSRNFAQAEDLYSACLPLMEQIYAGDSKAMADCLTALGDVYYWQDKFGLALPIYQRLLAMRERMKDSSPAAIVTAYLKNAKAQEHMNNIEAAQDLYRRATELAQKTLMLGHPLLSSVLEAYANFLQEKTTNHGLAEDMRRKAKTSKETYVDPSLLSSDAMEGRVSEVEWKQIQVKKEKDPSIWLKQDEEESNNPLVVALRSLRKHPRLAVAFLTLPITLGMLVVIICATYFLSGGEAVQTPLVRAQDVFRTPDARQTLEVLPNNKVQIKTPESNLDLEYITLSNPWRQLQYFFFESPARDVLLIKKGDSLQDIHGNTMEPGGSPHISTISQMEKFSKELHKVNSLTAEQFRNGKLKEFCAQYTYENPYTHRKESPNVIFAELEHFARVEQIFEYFRGTRGFEPEVLVHKVILKGGKGRMLVSPSLLKCIVVPDYRGRSKASFIILATDNRGYFLRVRETDATLATTSIAGSEPKTNRSNEGLTKFSSTARVVFSKVSREGISTAANLLTWVLILLPVFLIGYKVFEPRFNRAQYVGKDSMLEVWLSYIYILALCAYICFFTGVVFYIMNL
jgi:tetratricopeptide (TPR) repeat protein